MYIRFVGLQSGEATWASPTQKTEQPNPSLAWQIRVRVEFKCGQSWLLFVFGSGQIGPEISQSQLIGPYFHWVSKHQIEQCLVDIIVLGWPIRNRPYRVEDLTNQKGFCFLFGPAGKLKVNVTGLTGQLCVVGLNGWDCAPKKERESQGLVSFHMISSLPSISSLLFHLLLSPSPRHANEPCSKHICVVFESLVVTITTA